MFKNLLKKRQEGFTIIEVMIVLAIAGLILVVVLIAIPQLQRNQRDTNRQNVVARLSTELGTYSGNNNGAYPFDNDADLNDNFYDRYIDGKIELRNPSTGNDYNLELAGSLTDEPAEDQLMVYPGSRCDGENLDSSTTLDLDSRQFAARIQLEGGDKFYCVDNS